jgi:hypothetical protein
MNQNIPAGDAAFENWGINFVTVATANASTLGIKTTDVAALDAAKTGFSSALTNVTTTKTAYLGATATKRASRTSAEATYRKYAKQFLANPALTPALLSSLGFSVTPAPSVPATPPTDLAATGFSNGVNKLVWKRAGNPQSTVFVIEAKTGTGSWAQVGATSKVKFSHNGQTPGVQVIYRVRAQRGNETSAPSNTAIVYGTGASSQVFLQQAA